MSNCITITFDCQENLLEKELKRRFAPKKEAASLLASSYERLGFYKKSERVSSCGSFLEFVAAPSKEWRLRKANFCRERLCPMCSWRRSYKIFSQISKIMNVIENDFSFLFLTLTVPNVSADKLNDTIDLLQAGWRRLIHHKRFKASVKGFFKVLEITRNKQNNTYHPHYHVILAVDERYFKTVYISHSEWLDLWRWAMNDDSITQVDIRRCKSKQNIKSGEKAVKALSSAVAEVAKYSVKSADYLGKFNKEGILISPYPNDDIDDFVSIFSSALYHRRLTALGGIFDVIAKQLQLDDVENGDLVHIDDNNIRSDVGYMVACYGWSCGAYKLIYKGINND